MSAIADLPLADRVSLSSWIGESAGAVLANAALLSGNGRVWFHGDAQSPTAALVESALVPGEPQGFGVGEALLDLLTVADGWTCVEVDPMLHDDLSGAFERRWGLPGRSWTSCTSSEHRRRSSRTHSSGSSGRRRRRSSRSRRPTCSPSALVGAAARLGRVFAAVDGTRILGHGSSLAASQAFADVGVHVAQAHRGQGIATAAAGLACRAVGQAGLTPVWGAGSENTASRRVAEKLGFEEVARLVFLVPATR